MKFTLLAIFLAATTAATSHAADMKLWYEKPATDWETEALPIGNGRLGAMIFGGTEREQIQFNEDTLWIGDEQDTGAYQAFGDLFIDFEDAGEVTNYRRELDIARAVQTVSYTKGGVNYRREYFASNPSGVLIFRFTADQPGALNGVVTLSDAHKGTTSAAGDTLAIKGNLAGYVYKETKDRKSYDIALDYEARARVRNEGGSVEVQDTQLAFKNVDTLTIYLDAGTNYINKREKKWRGQAPAYAIANRLANAAGAPYGVLLDRHLRDYQSLFNRVILNTGTTAEAVSAPPGSSPACLSGRIEAQANAFAIRRDGGGESFAQRDSESELGGAPFAICPLPHDLLLAARRLARHSPRALEQQHPAAMALRLPCRHQPPDELLVRGCRQYRRMFRAVLRVAECRRAGAA